MFIKLFCLGLHIFQVDEQQYFLSFFLFAHAQKTVSPTERERTGISPLLFFKL